MYQISGSVSSPQHHQIQHSYFLPSASPPSPPKWNMSTNYFNYQSKPSPPPTPFQPVAHSSLIHPHSPIRYSRRHEDPEPMSTSPLMQHQSREFLPSFLTAGGDTQHSTLNKPGTPERRWGNPSISFQVEPIRGGTSETLLDNEKDESPPLKQGPPISGIGRTNENKQFSPLVPSSSNSSIRNLNSSTGFFTTPTDSSSGIVQPSKMISASSLWVTVFGFPGSYTPNIIAHFSNFGTILETKTNPGSNWVHLKYSNVIEARRALYKNGTVVFGAMMVGVVPCEDPIAKESTNAKVRSKSATSSQASEFFKENVTPLSSPTSGSLVASSVQEIQRKMRPMTGRGKEEMQIAKQKTGLMSWAIDSIFGW